MWYVVEAEKGAKITFGVSEDIDKIKLNGEKTFILDEKSYHALIITEGAVEIASNDYSETLLTGQTVFIPANMGEYVLTGKATVILTTNPV